MFKKIVLILKNIIYKLIYKRPKVMNSKETVDYIIKNKCSIARFGDGEMNIILGYDIVWFQQYSLELQKKLIKVAESRNDSLLICIPEIMTNIDDSTYETDSLNFWKRHSLLKGGFYNKYFMKQKTLGDSGLTRFYLGRKNNNHLDDYVLSIKQLWDTRNLLIVEGYNTKLGIDNDLLDDAKSIRRIICPNVNAFYCYEKIVNAVIKNYHNDDLVLIALGPTATILAYDLSNNYNIQALDLGHIDIEYEWYKRNSKEKTIINNKNTAETAFSSMIETDITKDTIVIIK